MFKKNKKQKQRKFFSLAFYLAIFSNFSLGAVGLITLISILRSFTLNQEVWAAFGCGLIGTLAVVATSELARVRTLIHELKHAAVAILTGNSVTSFSVRKHSGSVTYELKEGNTQYAPIITLAPYFFPLFSFPTFILCLVFENLYPTQMSLALGISLGLDLGTAFGELRPEQTDFKAIVGGFIASACYIAGTHFLWTIVCLLWVAGGYKSFIITGYFLIHIAEKIVNIIGPMMR